VLAGSDGTVSVVPFGAPYRRLEQKLTKETKYNLMGDSPSVCHRHCHARGTEIAIHIGNAHAKCVLAITSLPRVPGEFCARTVDALGAEGCPVDAERESVRVAGRTLNTSINRCLNVLKYCRSRQPAGS
jgi:hypothetical protein